MVPWDWHPNRALPGVDLDRRLYHSLPWNPEPLAPGTLACRLEGLVGRPAPSGTG